MKLLKRHFNALERVFAVETDVNDPIGLLQSRAKVFADLEREGYLTTSTQKIHFKDGLPPITVTGYVLTPAGHLIYCEYAAKNATDVEEL